MPKASKLSSNGGKDAVCVRCQATIAPYAGVAANTHSTKFTHHPGQCADAGEREASLRAKATANGFAWSCRQMELGEWNAAPSICDEAGADRAAYERHMKAHGMTAPTAQPKVRLRKRAPAAPRVAPLVLPFKYLTWTERKYGPWEAGVGNPLIGECERRGQYWSNTDTPNSVWVIPLEHAPWESTARPPAPVQLYLTGIPGQYTTDWSAARSERREAKRRAGKAA
jgi:hypothetical protein